jgi:hypothetical protein
MSIHKTAPRNGINADILTAAIPGWADLRETAERFKREVIARQAEQPTPLEARRATNEALMGAKAGDLQDVLDSIREDKAHREAVQADLEALTAVRDAAENRLADAEQTCTEQIVDEVRARVEKVASTVYGLRHRPVSAQQAIDLDAAKEWKRLGELAAEWTELTRAYMALTRGTVDGPALSSLAPAAFISDPLAYHPHFIARRRAAGDPNSRPQPDSFHHAMNDWSASAPAPRFNTDQPKGTAVPMGTDPVAWIVYLAENTAFAVHDPEHAIELWQAAAAATEPITRHSAESRAQSRVRYAQTIGDEDLSTVEDLRPIEKAQRRPGPRGSFFA